MPTHQSKAFQDKTPDLSCEASRQQGGSLKAKGYKPTISIIVALSHNHIIGQKGVLPWHLPNDLKHFKAKTLGKSILMGRQTFESINSKPLPNRHNIILTRNPNFYIESASSDETTHEGTTHQGEVCSIAHTPEEVISLCKTDELMIIGGQVIYELFLPIADRLYLTLIDAEIEGDAHFPEWSPGEWVEKTREAHKKDPFHGYNYEFVTLNRR